jgi:hypothetical protein
MAIHKISGPISGKPVPFIIGGTAFDPKLFGLTEVACDGGKQFV